MHILFITDEIGTGTGRGTYGLGLADALTGCGHRISCIVQKRNDQVPYVQKVLLEEPLTYLANPLRSFLRARKIRPLVCTIRPDVVHIIAEPYATLIPFLKLRAPVVLTVHGTYAYMPHLLLDPFRRAIAWCLTSLLYIRVTNVIAVSLYTKSFLLSHVPFFLQTRLRKKIEIIPNGIPAESIVEYTTPHKKGTRARFICVGGVKYRKGILEALEGLAAYKSRSGEEFVFQVVGSLTQDIPYVKRVRARIEELGLNANVRLLGTVSDEQLAILYTQADVYIMLSVSDGKEFEGFGIAYLEANAHGIPAIGARHTAGEEAIQEGISGYVVEAKDSEALASAITTILAAGEELRISSKAWALEHTWDSIAKRYEEVYRSILKKLP